MAIFDFLTGGKAKRARALQLCDLVNGPAERLHALIHDAGVARMSEGFEPIWTRFVDCRLYRPAQLTSLPREDRDALDGLVASQIVAARPLFAEIRVAMETVLAEWRDEGLVTAAGQGCLRALSELDDTAEPRTDQDRLFRTVAVVEVDMACADVRNELTHIAKSPSIFW